MESSNVASILSGTSTPARLPGDHVVILHRWTDHYARYERYVDHDEVTVTYVMPENARLSVPARARRVEMVSTMDDLPAVRAAVAAAVVALGRPARIIALHEGDLDLAAELRVEYGCPGWGPEHTEPLRDKLLMIERVRDGGVRTPTTAAAATRAEVERFVAEHGLPVVVKPRRGFASRGVLQLDRPADVAGLPAVLDGPSLVQSFVHGAIHHVDGVWTGSDVGVWRASRYINACADFGEKVLGSVEVDDPEVEAVIEPSARLALLALTTEPTVFHMELFVDDDGTVTFLECGARVGGAEIAFLWREVHGRDLMSVAFDCQMGRALRREDATATSFDEVAGWLLVPVPVTPPCRVVDRKIPPPGTDGHYAAVVPPVGAVMSVTGSYEHVGGRFRYRGPSGGSVESAIRATTDLFRLDCEPLILEGTTTHG